MMAGVKPLDEIKAELEQVRTKKAAQKSVAEPTRRDWYGLVYLNKEGYCSILTFENGEQKSVCLGRSIEFIPYLRDQGIDGNDIDAVLAAFQKLRVEQNGVINHRKNRLTRGQGKKPAPEITQGNIKHPPNNAQSCQRHEVSKNALKGHSEAKSRGVTINNRR